MGNCTLQGSEVAFTVNLNTTNGATVVPASPFATKWAGVISLMIATKRAGTFLAA